MSQETAVENKVKIKHVKDAALWALTFDEWEDDHRIPIIPGTGEFRCYNQTVWDCGTTCCIWGAARLMAGLEPVLTLGWSDNQKLLDEFSGRSSLHRDLIVVLCDVDARPGEVLDRIEDAGWSEETNDGD